MTNGPNAQIPKGGLEEKGREGLDAAGEAALWLVGGSSWQAVLRNATRLLRLPGRGAARWLRLAQALALALALALVLAWDCSGIRIHFNRLEALGRCLFPPSYCYL